MEPVPEDWHRGLVVVAHPDDIEYGAAAAVARWTEQGKDIRYVLATSGEAGIAGLHPAESGPLREAEERRSAAVVGVTDVRVPRVPRRALSWRVSRSAATLRRRSVVIARISW